uniref:Glutamate racemase n=1 Tax=uncultured Elusimicrobia bacterium TaxID=699876 RepID=A0A650EPH9_9BACT|nr:glutamate racemase [uncultured Elusimicrobia bacterium]
MSKQAIGVFDSGLGGLTILSALRRRLPNENLIYFGDTANVPYGSKSKDTVTRFSLAIAHFLEEQNVKLIVVACNTASALALGELRKQITVPVMGVIEPGAEKAVRTTQNGKIAVLGTEATVKSRAYPKAVLKRNKHAQVTQQACPLFVPLVEENWAQTPAARLTAETYLESVAKSGADTVILGCTHYPVLKPVIAQILGKKVTLVDSADTLAEAVQTLLIQNGQAALKGKGRLTVFASDDPKRFKRLAGCLLSDKIGAVRLKKLNV